MAPGMSLGAPKVGQRSSSLSWTVQINRNRSRPGADRVRFGIDLAPRTYFSRFWDGFWSILGWFLGWFWKDFQWILGSIFNENLILFNDFSHMFGTISLTYSLMIPAWDPATPRSKHLRFSIIWGRAWGFKSAIYILFEKKRKEQTTIPGSKEIHHRS